MSRITQSHLTKYYRAFSRLVAAMQDCKRRYSRKEIPGGRRGFQGHSAFVKRLLALNQETVDYTVFEVQLKRRLVRINHRVRGYKENARRGIAYHMPVVYQDAVQAYLDQLDNMLCRLADVDISSNHQHLLRVDQILAK